MTDATTITCPPELAGIAHSFDRISSPQKRASVAALMAHVIAEIVTDEDTQPRMPLSETDEDVAECIESNGPVNAARIAFLCSEQGRYITDQGVRDRMRSGLPLRSAGYHYDKAKRGYVSSGAGQT